MNVDEQTIQRIVSHELDRFLDGFEVKQEIKFATFFGQVTAYLDERLAQGLRPMEKKLDTMNQNISNFLDRMDANEVERAAMNAQLGRHESWISQLAGKTDTKLPAA